MKYNPEKVAALQPDYLGFIFYKDSPRNYDGQIPAIPNVIKKVGVFVDADLQEVLEKIKIYDLQAVQLHGSETPAYCDELMGTGIEVIKVFAIKDTFDFSVLTAYENKCHYYLFDTKGKLPGGNGYAFNWNVLQNYPSSKSFFLSGGIGLDEVNKLSEFLTTPTAKYCYAIDVNSKFEIKPGLKDIAQLKKFKSLV